MPEDEKQYSFKQLTVALEQAWEGSWTWDVPPKADGSDPDVDDAIAAHPGLSQLSEEEFDEVGEAVNHEKEKDDGQPDFGEFTVPRKLYDPEQNKG